MFAALRLCAGISARQQIEDILRVDRISPKLRVPLVSVVPEAESLSDLRAGLRHGTGSQESSVQARIADWAMPCKPLTTPYYAYP
jgi:hypothetical protein